MNPDILSNFPLYFIVFTDRHRIYACQIWHHSFDMQKPIIMIMGLSKLVYQWVMTNITDDIKTDRSTGSDY